MTSTPSATAWLDRRRQVTVPKPPRLPRPLYAMTRARGAMPEIVPRSTPAIDAFTPTLPAAVAAVWRAVTVVVARGVELVGVRAVDRPVRRQHLARAEQLVVACERRVVRIGGRVAELAREARVVRQRSKYEPSSAKLGCSGQMPVSMTPTTTPSPVYPFSHAPPGASSPRKDGLASVVFCARRPWPRRRLPGWCSIASASSAVSSAEKPLRATVYSLTWRAALTPALLSALLWLARSSAACFFAFACRGCRHPRSARVGPRP